MLRNTVVVFGAALVASPLTAQDPFAFTGGSVKSAYIVYDVISREKKGTGMAYEMGVAPDRWIMRMKTPFEMGGKKDTALMLAVTTRDSLYKYNVIGTQRGEGEVSPTIRFHLAREYAALDAAGKSRFKENLKLGTSDNSGDTDDLGSLITLTGEKAGSETIAGHKCDVYKRKGFTACVMPGAPMVMLRWSEEKNGVSLVARKVTLNSAIPSVASVLPKGVTWKKKPADDADFITGIWAMKKQTDPEVVPPAQLAKFAVSYLASAAAATELREMSGSGDEPADDEAAEGESPEGDSPDGDTGS